MIANPQQNLATGMIEPWGEAYFPEGLGEHSEEGTLGLRQRVEVGIRQNPWPMLMFAVGFGVVMGLVLRSGRADECGCCSAGGR